VMALTDFLARLLPGRDRRERARRLEAFAASIRAASVRGDRPALERLLDPIVEFGVTVEEADLEIEMVHGSLDLLDLSASIDRGEWPIVPTQHKIIGARTCRFSAPVQVSGTDETGKLFLTDNGAVLLLGKARNITWAHVAGVRLEDRDIVLTRRDGQPPHMLRCNTRSEAMRGEYLARRLHERSRSTRQP
jgi:hypothetical protein